ncbi:MAG: MFS transporter [Anaerolineales bacterium]|nr:MFS transporter [Anaerolineales bacterium]MCS7247676.1 MFS transporter [Anaerolineales bacterium]MDW8161486.1 MFS transporter [Anaerolineales bacterium]MDW8447048.1 MFS transporter [Anaerolineales bacterium]
MQVATRLQRANFRRLYADIFWFGVLSGSTLTFLAVYVARLGGSSVQVGLITAIPGLVNLLFSMPFGAWLQGKPLLPVTVSSLLLHRLGYLAFVFLPWLFPPRIEIWAIILITLLMHIPGTLQAIAFNALFAEVVAPEWRAEVVGKRFAIQSFSLSAASLLCGQLLDRIVFPLNYQLIFLIGALSALFSTHAVARLVVESGASARLGARTVTVKLWLKEVLPKIALGKQNCSSRTPGVLSAFVGLRREWRFDLLRTSFGPFMGAYLAFYTVQYVPIPLFPLVQVNLLHMSDGQISFATALFHTSLLFGSLGVSRLAQRKGHRWMLVNSGAWIFLFPLLYALARSATLIYLNNAFGGVIWAGLFNATMNRLMERVPEDDRPAHMALHNLVLNLGMLGGSLFGSALAEWLGLRPAMFIAAALRLAGAYLLWKYG